MKINRVLTSLILYLSFLSLNAQPGTLRSDFADNGIFTFDITGEDEIQDLALLSDGSFVACGYLPNNSYDGIIMRISGSGQVIWSKQIDVGGNTSVDDFQGVVVINDEIYVQANSYNTTTSKLEIVILKFDINGNTMTDFGVNGRAVAVMGNGLLGFEMDIDSEGNFYVFGRTYVFNTSTEDGLVVKFNSNGQLDASFGANGISEIGIGSFRTGFLEGMIIDGETYVVGWYHDTATAVSINEKGVVVKLKADGKKDPNFGNNGSITFNVSNSDIIDDIVQHGEDHFLIGASGGSPDDIYIKRYTLLGKIDSNFGNNGTVKLDFGDDDDVAELLVRDDLGIFVCATLNDVEDFALISLNANGTTDSSFGSNGKIVIDIDDEDNVSEGILMPNGDVLLGGESDEDNDGDFAIVRIEGYFQCSNSESNKSLSGCEEVSFEGVTYGESGTYDLVTQTASGCDSTVHLNVTIKNASLETINLSGCDMITVNAETYSTSGTFTQVLVAQNGCDSTLTINIGILNSSQETMDLAECEPVTINGETYSISGSYTQNLLAQNGCDSTLTLNIDIETLESNIHVNESGTLISDVTAAQYQWVNCTTNANVSGATSSSFMPTETGDYALIISSEMCSDTSSCINVTISGTDDFSDLSNISLFPNPVNSSLFIRGIDQSNISRINLYNLSGVNILHNIHKTNLGIRLDVDQLISGLYYIQILDKDGNQKVLSFVKENSM